LTAVFHSKKPKRKTRERNTEREIEEWETEIERNRKRKNHNNIAHIEKRHKDRVNSNYRFYDLHFLNGSRKKIEDFVT
jgi:hypothetical protein